MAWFLGTRHMTEAPEAWHERLPDHFAWLKPLHDDGIMIMSGPSKDMQTGIYVLRCRDLEQAQRVVQGDPLLGSPGATVDVVEWQLHQIMGVGSFGDA